MSGPLERQGIHIPEPECPTIVMAAPPAHTHHSTVPQQYGLSFEIDDNSPVELTVEGVCSEQTINCEKGSVPYQTGLS